MTVMIRRILTLMLALITVTAAIAVGTGTAAAASDLSPAKLGYAGYAKQLDKKVFSGQLGAIYSSASTTFRLWSPVASSVSVCLYQTGSDDEEGAMKIAEKKMKYSEQYGTWYLTLNGDYQNLYYTYLVTVDGKKNEVVDPYAKAVGVNGNRGMIVNLSDTDPEGWENDHFARVEFATDAVVWEVSVRDFSADPSSGVSEENRGRFLAFTESDTTLNGEGDVATCVAYLRELGVNYVQINPFYDFASIDEADTETPQYNWGYDPKNYNVPEGSYSSDPYDGSVRIRECKAMIQALHEAGIGVIMDVVYNHTYFSQDSYFNKIVPNYYYRINEDGSWSNGSACGNDVASERYMVRRFIRDSVAYWAQEYHIDGFRFDLMGLIDVDTMNAVRKSLDALEDGDRIIMYGEAWNLSTSAPSDVKLANQDNVTLLSKRIGAFSDAARDGIRGFVTEGSPKSGVRASVSADGGGWTTTPNQCVNYTSCHDNLTFYDALTNAVCHDKQYELRREELLAMNKLSAAIVISSRGMPFMLAGEEMGRTKLGDGNSYISPIEVNRIDWNWLRKYASLKDYYSGLIRLRAAVGALRDPTGNRSSLEYLETKEKGSVAFMTSAEGSPTLVAAYNGSLTDELTLALPEGQWVILADGSRAGLTSLGSAEGTLTVPPTAAAILVDADSYPSIARDEAQAVVYLRYHAPETSDVFCEQRIEGALNEAYSAEAPKDIAFTYDLSGDTDALSGSFEQTYTVFDINCTPYEGGYSEVVFRYLDDSDQPVSEPVTVTDRIGNRYFSPAFPLVAGYRLDLERLPENGAGKLTEDNIEVVYRYVTDEGESASCRANVIYMAENGTILDTGTYTGSDGELLSIERLSFSGYEYLSRSDNYATFEPEETTVLMCYVKAKSNLLLYLLIGGGVILLLAGVFFTLSMIEKRRMIRSIEIDE